MSRFFQYRVLTQKPDRVFPSTYLLHYRLVKDYGPQYFCVEHESVPLKLKYLMGIYVYNIKEHVWGTVI